MIIYVYRLIPQKHVLLRLIIPSSSRSSSSSSSSNSSSRRRGKEEYHHLALSRQNNCPKPLKVIKKTVIHTFGV